MGCDDGHCDLVAGATNIMVHAWARPKGIRASCSGMGGATEARRFSSGDIASNGKPTSVHTFTQRRECFVFPTSKTRSQS